MAQLSYTKLELVYRAGHSDRQRTWRAKLWELLTLGFIIGACSLGLSWLWKGYEHKASDVLQYLNAEFVQEFSQEDSLLSLPFTLRLIQRPVRTPMFIIDIGEQTCAEWSKNYQGFCAGLPRLPHDRLADIFEQLEKSQPRLVVVDIDLRSDASCSDPCDPFDPDSIRLMPAEGRIVEAVKRMENTPFVVAQPLIRRPKEGQPQYHDYAAVPTILHKLVNVKPNLRFGHVEQDLLDDGILRRFPATELIPYSDPSLDPYSKCPARIEHAALRVCELGFCKSPYTKPAEIDCGAGQTTPSHFGRLTVLPEDYVEFRYSFGRDPRRRWNVKSVEAIDFVSDSKFDAKELNDAVVFLGSTAWGRGDHHLTPLDAFGGQTPGLIVLANEVTAALQNRWLEESIWVKLSEKVILMLITTVFVVYAFWRPRLRDHTPTPLSSVRKWLSRGRLLLKFVCVVAAAFLINIIVVWLSSAVLFRFGELADPVTPLIAVILDGLVELCSTIGSWFDQ